MFGVAMPDVAAALTQQMIAASDPGMQQTMAIVNNAIDERKQVLAVQRLELSTKVEEKMAVHLEGCAKCRSAGYIKEDCQLGSLILSACKNAMGVR